MTDRPKTIVPMLRAAPVARNEIVPDLVLETTAEPDAELSLDDARALYERHGEAIADALFAHLPGGLVDRILCRLLARKASLLRVRLG